MTQIFIRQCPLNKVGNAEKKDQVNELVK